MSTQELTSALDPVVQWFTTGDYYREVYQAKQDFFERTGMVHEDDREYEQRMNLFMDWYLFDRDLPSIDLPPVRYYARKHQDQFDETTKKIFESLNSSIHSLFELKRFSFFGKNPVIQDLFSKKKYMVISPEHKDAFAKGDIFEARIFPHQGKWVFSNGFCFHPVEMKPFIKGEINKIRFQDKSRHLKLILQLAGMRLKHQRFPHIEVHHIYKIDSRF